MKQDEIFEPERESLYHTDVEENQEEISDYESSTDSSPSSPYKSNTNQWPWSYRKSVDMLTGITPPSSATLVSFFNKKQQISGLGSFSSFTSKQPLLEKDDEVHNSAVISIKSFLASHLMLSVPELLTQDENRNSSFSQSVFNGINILCGTALLTMPYAMKESGWLGLLVLFCFGIITCYTGILLQRCLESSPGLYTYVDIVPSACLAVSSSLLKLDFVDILMLGVGCCVNYIIMMSDNLSGLFPINSLNIAGFSLDSTQIFAIATALIVLPTVWLKDLSLLSYLSAGGVFSSILLAVCLFWVGSVDGLGFRITGQALNLTSLPVAVGIYAFGFAGHSVFPNIYSSMKEPSKFPLVVITSFGFCTVFSIAIGVCGYTIFGDEIQSQFTLNMPQQFTSSKLAMWTIVITPLTKYICINNNSSHPVVLSLEELLPSSKMMRSKVVSLVFRTILVLSTLVVALTFPFLETVAALIGSFIAMLIAFIFPCLCHLKISKGRLTTIDMVVCTLIIIIGVVSGCCGTYAAVARLIGQMT